MARVPAIVDQGESERVARIVRARPRRCWQNAACSVSVLGARAWYVEGWIVVNPSNPIVIEHGWCEINGRIVDPSYARRICDYTPPLAYWSGKHYSPREAHVAIDRRRLPISWASKAPDYRRAFQGAWRDAMRRKLDPRSPPTRVVNCREEPADLFIGRPSKWQNPYRVGVNGNRETVLKRFREWFIRQPRLLLQVASLRGKTLGCDCPPAPCHGHVIAELVNRI
jgi:hypothetical protein